jgi:hypothetical protein
MVQPKRKLKLIAGYFKADKPEEGGFNTIVRKGDLENISEALEVQYSGFLKAPKDVREQFLSHEGEDNIWHQLRRCSQFRDSLPRRILCSAFRTRLFLLTQHASGCGISDLCSSCIEFSIRSSL